MGNAQTEAKKRYNKKNYDTILLSLPKGTKSQLKDFAAEQGMAVNKLLNNFVMGLLEKDTNISTEQQKVAKELHQEAEGVRKNLKTMQKASEAKPEEYLIKRKGFAPLPTRKLLGIWIEKRGKGYSYVDLVEYTKELTGHKYAAKTIGMQIDNFLEQVKVGLAEPILTREETT